jgi:hypothetical protein
VNNIDKSSVVVAIQSRHVSISAQHPTKALQLSFSLLRELDHTASTWSVNTFGINLVLKKASLQEVWGGLLPAGVHVPKNSHHW